MASDRIARTVWVDGDVWHVSRVGDRVTYRRGAEIVGTGVWREVTAQGPRAVNVSATVPEAVIVAADRALAAVRARRYVSSAAKRARRVRTGREAAREWRFRDGKVFYTLVGAERHAARVGVKVPRARARARN